MPIGSVTMTAPRLTSTGRLPRDLDIPRQGRAIVDPAALRAQLIRAGIIRERDQDLPPLRVALEGQTVVRMTALDKQIAQAHIAQGVADPRRWRDQFDSRAPNPRGRR